MGVRQRLLLEAADASSDSALQQCTWSPGVGCSLGPGYVAKSLAYQSDVPVAQFLAASLTCKSITNRGVLGGNLHVQQHGSASSSFTNLQCMCSVAGYIPI